MASTIHLLLAPKSLLHRLGMSPLPRFYTTGAECSQLFEAEGLTASKDIHNPRTKYNPLNLSEIFKHNRFQIDTSFRLYNPLHIFKMQSDPQNLVRMFKQSAEKQKFRRLLTPYEVTVKKLAFAKQFDAIEEILEHSLQVSKPCSEAFIIRIILLYGMAGMPQHAIKTFNQMKISPTIKSFNALLNALNKSKNPKLAHDFYKDIDSFGVSPTLKTYNIVVKAICEMNEHESALSFPDEMRKHSCEPDVFTYNTILSALYQHGKYKEADDLLGKMTETFPPNVVTYNIRMCHLCDCNKSSDAEKLLDEIVSKELKPNILTFNTLIADFCKENNMAEAKRIFSDISRKGCDPNAQTYYTLIYFSSKEGDFDTAYEFCMESMRRNWMPYFRIAKVLIDGLVKNNKVENAREVIEGMKKKLPVSCHKELENLC